MTTPNTSSDVVEPNDPRWGQASICLHQAGYHDLGEFIDQAADLLSLSRSLAREVEEVKGERDEAIRDRNAHADHVLRIAKEAEDGFAALEMIDRCWEACGVPGNRKHLSLDEQVAAIVRDLHDVEDKLQTVEKALTAADEPEHYNPSVLQRAEDIMRAYEHNQTLLLRRSS